MLFLKKIKIKLLSFIARSNLVMNKKSGRTICLSVSKLKLPNNNIAHIYTISFTCNFYHPLSLASITLKSKNSKVTSKYYYCPIKFRVEQLTSHELKTNKQVNLLLICL